MSDYYAWTPEQVALVQKHAGRTTPAVIARLVSEIGPPRTLDALYAWASRQRVSIRPNRPTGRMPDRQRHLWTPAEDALLRRLAGRASAQDIAAALNARFYTTRGAYSVLKRAFKLDVSVERRDGIGMTALTRTFGMHSRRVIALVDAGLLRAEQRGAGRKGAAWLFLPADIEACIRAHPYLFDWRRVAPGRWRDLVRATSLRDPYLTVREVAAMAGIRSDMVQKWIRHGRIREAVKVGPSRFAELRIPLRAIEQIEQLAAEMVRRSA